MTAVLGIFIGCLLAGLTSAQEPMFYEGYSCEGQAINLVCPREYVMEITWANYGRLDQSKCLEGAVGGELDVDVNCTSDSVLDILKTLCNGREWCTYVTDREALGNPCPRVWSYLEVKYACHSPFMKRLVCENFLLSLQCPLNKVINIVEAMYGRQDPTTCAFNKTPKLNNCSSSIALQVLRKRCNNKNKCYIIPRDSYLGDNCREGEPSYLNISLSCLDCVNLQNDSDCEMWAKLGECKENSAWMLAFCRRSCTKCDVTCKNKFNDQDCEAWATRGECINTPDFMLVQCAQSCGSCDTIPTSSPYSVSLIPPRVAPLPYFLVSCGEIAEMKCPSGYKMTIGNANFGRQSNSVCLEEAGDLDTERGCLDESILQLIKDACDGQESCNFDVPASYINNDLCPGIHKYLNVTFTCAEPVFRGLRCDEESLRLQCQDRVIMVNDVMYGRQDVETCQNDAVPLTTSCSSPDAFTLISQLCNYKHFCDITVTRDLLDDPCPGTHKYMDLSFSCMECKNLRDDIACELWAERGECVNNTGWMMAQCRKSCTGCHLAASCVNALGNDQQCNDWAATGECRQNPKFMHAQCQRSCNRCQNPIQMPSPQLRPMSRTTTKKPAELSKIYELDTCEGASVTLTCPRDSFVFIRDVFYGRDDLNSCPHPTADTTTMCASLAVSRMRASWVCTGRTSCSILGLPASLGDPCPGVYKQLRVRYSCEECVNGWSNDNECSTWTTTGQCNSNPAFMLSQCFKNCSECFKSESCKNVYHNDSMCDSWALIGQCLDGEEWMTENCRQSCRLCGVDTGTTTLGTTALPPVTTETSASITGVNTARETTEDTDSGGMGMTGTVTTDSETMMPPTTSTVTMTTASQGSTTIGCVNRHKDEQRCVTWAQGGYCEGSTVWMTANCYKACSGCAGGPNRFPQSTTVTPQTTTQQTTIAATPTTTESTMGTTTTTPFLTTTAAEAIICNPACIFGRCVANNTCQCDLGYQGNTCQQFNCDAVNGCNGHGACTGPNSCTCFGGWTGVSCLEPVCSRGCNGKGLCVGPDKCWCFPYYAGYDCSICGVQHSASMSCVACAPCEHGICTKDTTNVAPPHSYLGCYQDVFSQGLGRVLWVGQPTSVLRCIETCLFNGYKYAAINNGSTCSCGDMYSQLSPSGDCYSKCSLGEEGQLCGGLNSVSVYLVYEGKCTCESVKWTGVLCKQCAPGYQGDMCLAVPTKIPPTQRTRRTSRPVTPSDRAETSSTKTSAATSTSTQTSSTSASSTSSPSSVPTTPQDAATMGGPAGPSGPEVPITGRPRPPPLPTREQDVRDGARSPNVVSSVTDSKYIGMYMSATVSQRWRPDYANDDSDEYEVFTEAIKSRLETFYKGHFPTLDYVLVLGLRRDPAGGVAATYYLEFRQPMTEQEGFKVECAIYEETDHEIYVNMNNAWSPIATNKTTNQQCIQRNNKYCGENGVYSRKESGEKYCKCKDGYRGARCSSIPEWVIIVVVVVSCVCSLALIIIICICVNRKKTSDQEKGHMGADSIKTAKSHMSGHMSHVSVVSSKGGPRPKMVVTERHPSHYNSYY